MYEKPVIRSFLLEKVKNLNFKPKGPNKKFQKQKMKVEVVRAPRRTQDTDFFHILYSKKCTYLSFLHFKKHVLIHKSPIFMYNVALRLYNAILRGQ